MWTLGKNVNAFLGHSNYSFERICCIWGEGVPSAFSSSGKTVSESQSQISSKRSRRSSGVKGLVSQSAMSKKAPAVRSHLTWRWRRF